MRLSGTLVSMGIGRLDPGILEAALTAVSVGHTVEYHGSVPSTMPLARKLALDPATAPGAIVIAEEQTAGRGRLTRGWEAPIGDALLLTVVLKPPLLPLEPAQMPMIAGISIVEAIGQVAPSTAGLLALKWPNDVLLRNTPLENGNDVGNDVDIVAGSAGKVAGILIESAYTGPTMDYALLGMGINANQKTDSLQAITGAVVPATSIRRQIGRSIDRAQLCIALCSRLAKWLSSAKTKDGCDRVHRQWRSLLTTLGRDVTIQQFSDHQVLEGRAVDVDHIGNLVVEDIYGRRHSFGAGDVTLRPA
jgi:BirA family biotin operon repressor/biotin-[acetyl-CoA-carboxylase] ligase